MAHVTQVRDAAPPHTVSRPWPRWSATNCVNAASSKHSARSVHVHAAAAQRTSSVGSGIRITRAGVHAASVMPATNACARASSSAQPAAPQL